MRTSHHVRALALIGALSLLPGAALGETTAIRRAPSVDGEALSAKLRAGEPAAVLEALAAVRDAGPGAAAVAPDVERLLVSGATVEVAAAAIEALGAIGLPSSSAVIRPYVRHRVASLRRGAVQALAHTKGPEAVAALREGLRSGDPAVRGYAASGLGALGAAEALPDLFKALDLRVFEAASSIGQVCDPDACAELAGRLGVLPFDVMVSGLDPIFFRQPPLPDAVLLSIVRDVQALATPEAGRFLADVRSRWPAGGSEAVKRAIDAAIASMRGVGS